MIFLCRCSAVWRSVWPNASSCSSNLFSLIVISRLIQILIWCSRLRSFPGIRTVSNSILIWSHLHCRLRCVSIWLIVTIWASSSNRIVYLSWSLLSLEARWFISSCWSDINISWSICSPCIASNWRYRITFSSFCLQVILLL